MILISSTAFKFNKIRLISLAVIIQALRAYSFILHLHGGGRIW